MDIVIQQKRITINLSPADLPKEGARYDLPIALAILIASEQLISDKLNSYEFIGELLHFPVNYKSECGYSLNFKRQQR